MGALAEFRIFASQTLISHVFDNMIVKLLRLIPTILIAIGGPSQGHGLLRVIGLIDRLWRVEPGGVWPYRRHRCTHSPYFNNFKLRNLSKSLEGFF